VQHLSTALCILRHPNLAVRARAGISNAVDEHLRHLAYCQVANWLICLYACNVPDRIACATPWMACCQSLKSLVVWRTQGAVRGSSSLVCKVLSFPCGQKALMIHVWTLGLCTNGAGVLLWVAGRSWRVCASCGNWHAHAHLVCACCTTKQSTR
jgi:hypothetical protein